MNEARARLRDEKVENRAVQEIFARYASRHEDFALAKALDRHARLLEQHDNRVAVGLRVAARKVLHGVNQKYRNVRYR